MLTSLLTGCRLSELVGLDIRDLRDVDGANGAKAVRVRGKGDKDRTVTIEAGLVDVLGEYLASRDPFSSHRSRTCAI
ncbi:hypothetical protein GCM10020255_018710 [Rhodococcus baikonurensis]